MATNENKTRVTILTESYRITGYIELMPGARVTDFMHESKEFVVVLDAEVCEADAGGRKVLAAPFIDVNRNHIHVITTQ